MTDAGKMKLEVLWEEYKADVSLQPHILEEQAMLAPTYVAKWIMQYSTYKFELEEMESQFNLLKVNEQSVIRSKLKVEAHENDINKLKLKYDKHMKDLADKISDHREILRVIGEFKYAIGFFRNDIKNVIEYRKLESI